MLSRMSAGRERRESGFTLIELLVVIIILGVLSAVVVFAVQGTGDKGKAAAFSTDARTLRTAQEAYCAQKGTYAVDDAALVQAGLLAEGGSLTHTRSTPTGPCGSTGFVLTCDPANPLCGQDGTTPDGDFTGTNPQGVWARTGDLPEGSQPGTMITMSNGKVLHWGFRGGTPPTCPSAGHPACYGTVASQTYGNWAPGPISIYDPATATWASAPVLPSRPAWDPLWRATAMTNIVGSAAECGTNCGKVLVQAQVGTFTIPSLVAPAYRNNDYFLFDPTAQAWTDVSPPAGIVTGKNAQLAQMQCGSRPAGSDCGKVMIYGFSEDNNGSNLSSLTPPLSNRDNNAPQFQPVLFDPLGATWGTTAAPVRRVANDGPANAAFGVNSGTGTVPISSFTVTHPGGGFQPSDVGKGLGARTVTTTTESGGWTPLNTIITAVSGCTGNSCTTATMSRMSENGGTAAQEVPRPNQVFTVGTGGSILPLSNVAGKPIGRIVIASGLTSAIYDPVAKAWTDLGQITVPATVRNNFTVTLSTSANVFTKRTVTITTNPPVNPPGPWYFEDIGSLVTGSFIPAGARIVRRTAARTSVLSVAPTNTINGQGTTLTVTGNPILSQAPTYTCAGSPERFYASFATGSGLPLANGSALVMPQASCAPGVAASSNAMTFDPVADQWVQTPVPCPCDRLQMPGMVQLGPNSGNRVLIAYGADPISPVGTLPASALGASDGSSWVTIPSLFTRRALNSDGTTRVGSADSATLTVLPTGQVLLAGGIKCDNVACSTTTNQTDTWIYTPPVG